MSNETRVYTLDPGMTQEEMAVTFAMTSRSPEAFKHKEQSSKPAVDSGKQQTEVAR